MAMSQTAGATATEANIKHKEWKKERKKDSGERNISGSKVLRTKNILDKRKKRQTCFFPHQGREQLCSRDDRHGKFCRFCGHHRNAEAPGKVVLFKHETLFSCDSLTILITTF